MLIEKLDAYSKWSAGLAYGMIIAFIFVLAFRGAILNVYYRFYITGRDAYMKI